MSQMLKTVELFAGIGGFRIAAEQNGLQTVWANDIEPTAAAVYQDNFGENSIVLGDIHNYVNLIPDHDILTGGFPCQPFSKAGKKQGIADYRGTLFEVIVNILKCKQPSYFVLENVNSLLYMDNGNHFRTILAALSSLGYKIEWRVFNAVSFGLAQHRERVIILGAKDVPFHDSLFLESDDIKLLTGDVIDTAAHYDRWQEITLSKEKFKTWGMALNGKFISVDVNEQQYLPKRTLNDILESTAPTSFDFTEDTLERIKNSQYVNKFYNGVQILYNQSGGARMGYSIFGTAGTSPTLTASTSRHYERYKVGNRFRRLTNIEYARLQGFPDDHCKVATVYNQYKLFGNAVPPQIISYVFRRILKNQRYRFEKQNFTIFDFGEEN